MSDEDRELWNKRYLDGTHHIGEAPPGWLEEVGAALPRSGRALDVASGAGRIALWLAERGLDTLAVDVSSEGLRITEQRAAERALTLRTLQCDLEHAALPEGPFDVITCFHYLQRELFAQIFDRLAPRGHFVCEIKTTANLERHAKPSKRFLLDPGELRTLCAPLVIERYEERWVDDLAQAQILGVRRG